LNEYFGTYLSLNGGRTNSVAVETASERRTMVPH
jgi:hypothetical protein